MDWRLATSLETLRSQINASYPNRSKASDGTIGDAAHQAVPSDHNPNAEGVVTALDLTHDPAHGFDAHAFADYLAAHPHPELKYIISNGRIAEREYNFQWRPYNGSNPHDKHIHISVGEGPDGRSAPGTYDSNQPWDIGGNMAYIDDAELKDLREWKERGMAAEPYKQAVQKSKAWQESQEDINNVKPVLDDLVQFKKDTLKVVSSSGAAEQKLIEIKKILEK